MTPALLLASALWLTAPAAAADRCAAVDIDRDTLTESERRSALLLLEDALASQGEAINAPCEAKWSVSHVKLGAAVTVSLSRGGDKQTLKVAGLDELPAAYERLVRAIKSGQPVAATADRSSVTASEANPNRAEADPLVYMQIGGGATGLDPVQGGVALGVGYRHALDKIAIDISGFNFVVPSKIEESKQFSMTLIEVGVLYYFDGEAASSPYAGGAVGYSFSTRDVGSGEEDSPVRGGAQGTATVGYELLRQSTIRLFPQLDVGVPFYTVRGQRIVSSTVTLNVAFRPPNNSGGGIRLF
jgi:hypothetical protein